MQKKKTMRALIHSLDFRTDARVSKKQPISEKYPVYTVTPRRVDYKSIYSDDIIPGKGEVIQDRFIQPRPFGGKEKPNVEERFTQPRPFASKPDPSYLPPPTYLPTKQKDDAPSYNSPYNSYNPPDLPPSYFYPYSKDKPFPPFIDKPKMEPPKMEPSTMEPPKMESPPLVPYSNYPYEKPNKDKPFPPGTPEYLDYNPYEKPKENMKTPNKYPPYSNYNPNDVQNHETKNEMSPEEKPNSENKFPPGIPPYLEYNPYEHNHMNHHEEKEMPPENHHEDNEHNHNDMDNHDHPMDTPDPESNPDTQMPKPNNEPPKNFPSYLYDKVPYLEYNHQADKGPPITQTVPPPDFHHYPYLDHYFHMPPIYHEIEHTTTTTEATKERVNKRPYTYYYIGRKLWYIPLYFSVYFIVYIFVLVLKSIARHKITFNQYFEEDRGMKNEENEMDKMTENVLMGIEHAEEKYEK